MRLEPRRHADRCYKIYAELKRRIGVSGDYSPSPYVRWFLPHVIAWDPTVTGREAITICHGFHLGGFEIGRAAKAAAKEIVSGHGVEIVSDAPDINMGLAPDSIRLSRGTRWSFGYKFAQRSKYPDGTLAFDKYLIDIGFWVGFHYAVWW